MAKTKWLGLWKQRPGLYGGEVICKSDIPKYTRIIVRLNKYYTINEERNQPRFVYCFADSRSYFAKCRPIEKDDDEDEYYDHYGNRLFTRDEVQSIILAMEEEHGLSYGMDLVEDYI